MKPTPENPVHSYMEEDQAVEANVTKQFYFLVRNLEMEHSFPTIRPVPKGPAPLQIADMIAYEGSRHFSEQIIAKSARPPRRLYLELKACQSLQFGESATAERVKDTTDRLMKAERQIREEDPDVDAQWAKNITAAGRQMQQERMALGRPRKRKVSGPRGPRGRA